MYRSLSNALICYIRYFPIFASKYIQIHMVDTWRWHTVLGNPKPFIHTNHLKWIDQRGVCIVVCITYGIDVFLLACIGAWYRLAKYIMIHEWGWSTRGPLFSRCIVYVLCMYLDIAWTACMETWWYMDHIWITYGSHNTLQLVGYVPKIHNDTWRYMTIHVFFSRGYWTKFEGYPDHARCGRAVSVVWGRFGQRFPGGVLGCWGG